MRRAFHLGATGAMLLVGSEALGQTSDIHERDDKFRPYREVFTSRHRAGAYPNLIGLRLVGRIERASGARTTLLEVEFAYMSDHKRGYDAARNDRAEALRFTPVSSTGRCRAVLVPLRGTFHRRSPGNAAAAGLPARLCAQALRA